MIIGQDECCFHQFLFSPKEWVASDGTRTIIPKDKRQGLMLSSFQGRELGFIPMPTDAEFAKIQAERQTF
jgi:hypothetical protein